MHVGEATWIWSMVSFREFELSTEQSKVRNFFGDLSFAALILQLLGLMGVMTAVRNDFNLFDGGSASSGGLAGRLIVSATEIGVFIYCVQFVAVAGFISGLIYLSRPPRNNARALVGIGGNMLLAAGTGLLIYG